MHKRVVITNIMRHIPRPRCHGVGCGVRVCGRWGGVRAAAGEPRRREGPPDCRGATSIILSPARPCRAFTLSASNCRTSRHRVVTSHVHMSDQLSRPRRENDIPTPADGTTAPASRSATVRRNVHVCSPERQQVRGRMQRKVASPPTSLPPPVPSTGPDVLQCPASGSAQRGTQRRNPCRAVRLPRPRPRNG